MRRWVWFFAGALLAACGGSSAPTATVAPAAPALPSAVTVNGLIQTATALAAFQPTTASTIAPTVTTSRSTTTPTVAQATANANRPGASATPLRTSVATAASPTTASVAGGTSFRDAQGRFSFTPDATWKNMAVAAFAARFTSDDATNSFTVTAQKAAAGVSLDQFVDQDIESLKRTPDNYQPAPRGRQMSMLGGETARELNYTSVRPLIFASPRSAPMPSRVTPYTS